MVTHETMAFYIPYAKHKNMNRIPPITLPAIDRRLLLKTGALGLAGLATPGAAQIMAVRGFTHGVASGEPSPSSILLWTRYASDSDTMLKVEMARTADFANILTGCEVTASPANDGCAKVTLTGLPTNAWLYYRFIAPDGSMSPMGRTRTLPEGRCDHFKLAVFSCANMGFGYFNAYAHAAERGDIDLAVHLGDYFYEYGYGTYPSTAQWVKGRSIQPEREAVALADYRLRYASYRADPDLRRLHQVLPMIAQWDDHEYANDPWVGGAQNHQPEEGDWEIRKKAARKAYTEWMPVSDHYWRSYDVGNLATIELPETRITGRSKQFDYGEIITGASNPEATLKAFRDGEWHDGSRSMMGKDQEAWLARNFTDSVRQGKRWQVLAQQVIMGGMVSPPEACNWVGPDAPDYVQKRAQMAQLAAKVGLPYNLDSWDGYPAARDRVFTFAQAAEANLIVLSGDSHNGWAFDLVRDGKPVGVEFAGHSVSSSGFESSTRGVSEADRVAAIRRANPNLKWANTESRGYMTVTLDPAKAVSEWVFMDTVLERSKALKGSATQTVLHGANRLNN